MPAKMSTTANDNRNLTVILQDGAFLEKLFPVDVIFIECGIAATTAPESNKKIRGETINGGGGGVKEERGFGVINAPPHDGKKKVTSEVDPSSPSSKVAAAVDMTSQL